MTRSERMKPVLKIAENRERVSVKRLNEWQQLLTIQENKLLELREYRDEYTQHFQMNTTQGMSTVRMQDYRIFLHKLNQAIEEQAKVVRQTHEDCESCRKQWQVIHGKTKAVDHLVDRFKEQELADIERAEQKESDERGQYQKTRY